MTKTKKILSLIRPAELVLLIFPYLLGLAVARYLGFTVNFGVAVFGGLFVLFGWLAAQLLEPYFEAHPAIESPEETFANRLEHRRGLLLVALSFLAVASILLISLALTGSLKFVASLNALGFLLLVLAIAVPPARLSEKGFGEFNVALALAVITPMLSFSLQTGETHRLLAFLSLPLFFLGLTALLALNFKTHAADLRRGKATLLIRLGWRRGITMHNFLLAVAYFMLVLAPVAKIPFSLVWPGLLSIPLALAQVFMLARISAGAKPAWAALNANALAIFSATGYFLLLNISLR